MFFKYQHVERYGTTETEGIEIGRCYVFPKLDGTNGSVWWQDGEVVCGSRNRELTIDDDNQGFAAYISQHKGIKSLLSHHQELRLYGEWLVPHSFKQYREEAWRKFYVFDVVTVKGDEIVYTPFDELTIEGFNNYGIDYIPPICIVDNGNEEVFRKALEKNTFLVKDGCGVGEGIVIKNYEYRNRFGRTTWAKIVTNEFKEKHVREMGVPVIKAEAWVEQQIVDVFVTEAFVRKEFEKLRVENNGWSSKQIPELLGRIFYTLIIEESWNMVKRLQNPTINYKILNALTVNKIKQVLTEVF